MVLWIKFRNAFDLILGFFEGSNNLVTSFSSRICYTTWGFFLLLCLTVAFVWGCILPIIKWLSCWTLKTPPYSCPLVSFLRYCHRTLLVRERWVQQLHIDPKHSASCFNAHALEGMVWHMFEEHQTKRNYLSAKQYMRQMSFKRCHRCLSRYNGALLEPFWSVPNILCWE